MSVKINYALIGINELHISEVSSGAVLNCPFCHLEVIAKKGVKNQHHFAHRKNTENSCSDFILFGNYTNADHLSKNLDHYKNWINYFRKNKIAKFQKQIENSKNQIIDFRKKWRKAKSFFSSRVGDLGLGNFDLYLQKYEEYVNQWFSDISKGNRPNQKRNFEIWQAYKSDTCMFDDLSELSSSKLGNRIMFWSYPESKYLLACLDKSDVYDDKAKTWFQGKPSSWSWFDLKYNFKENFFIAEIVVMKFALEHFIKERKLVLKDYFSLIQQKNDLLAFFAKEDEWHLYFFVKQINEDFLVKVGISKRINERFLEIKQETKIDFEVLQTFNHKGIFESWFKNYLQKMSKEKNIPILEKKTEYFLLSKMNFEFFKKKLRIL